MQNVYIPTSNFFLVIFMAIRPEYSVNQLLIKIELFWRFSEKESWLRYSGIQGRSWNS